MTREEIDKIVKEIREHCKSRNCRNCEARTIYGCVFMRSLYFSDANTEDYTIEAENE